MKMGKLILQVSKLILALVLMLSITGCDNFGKKDYSMENHIVGESLTLEQLRAELEEMLKNTDKSLYGEINLEMNSLGLSQSAEIQYNFESEDKKVIQLYADINLPMLDVTAFIKDGYAYVEYEEDGKKYKEKMSLDSVYEDYTTEEILDEFLSEIDILYFDHNEMVDDLIELIEESRSSGSEVLIVKDKKANIVIDLYDGEEKARIVIEKGKVIYIELHEDNMKVKVDFEYKKPLIKYPSTEEYEEVE